jgi:hypothetical protein
LPPRVVKLVPATQSFVKEKKEGKRSKEGEEEAKAVVHREAMNRAAQ